MRPRAVPVLAVPLLLALTPQATGDLLTRCRTAVDPVRRFVLPATLREVSGFAVAADGLVLTHNDSRGRVLALDPATGEVRRRYVLAGEPRRDFEGIAVAGDSVYLMTSTGQIYLFRDGADGDTVSFEVLETGLGRLCELEGLAWDPAGRVLLIPCKVQYGAGIRNGLLLFRWSPDHRRPATPPVIQIPAGALRNTLRVSVLRATAVEVDTASDRILVLSSQPQALVELDRSGQLRLAVGLRSSRHPQPEALALLPDALVIGDEGGTGRGTMTVYTCAP